MQLNKFLIGTFCFVGILSRRAISTTPTTMSNTTAGGGTPYVPGTHSVAFVTTPDEDTAKRLAHLLVSSKLVACVNIIPGLISIYEWEGAVNEDNEVLMMIKTSTSKIDEVSKFVRDNHPYSVAEVISFPIENGNNPYLEWISKTVGKGK